MRELGALLSATLVELNGAGAEAALVGGLATSVRTEPRFTRDIDLAVAVADDVAAQALVADLVSRGWQVGTLIEQDATKRLAAVRLSPPGESPAGRLVDLLFQRDLVADLAGMTAHPS